MVLAVADVIALWTNDQYKGYLPRQQSIDRKWFDRFVANWGVALTVLEKHRGDVLNYLNTDFRAKVGCCSDGTAITAAARDIAAKQWTPMPEKSKEHSKPVSLVSKIAFFFRPDFFVPFDAWARKGLRAVNATGNSSYKTYEAYFADFGPVYDTHKPEIERVIASDWAVGLAEQLACPETAMQSEAFKRKVLDNALMRFGGRPL